MNIDDAKSLAEQLMEEHGLSDQGWNFEFDEQKRRFGACNYKNKLITLSWRLVIQNDEAHVLDTILHEIAHALTPGHHHDSVWVAKAKELGSNGQRCYDSKVVAKAWQPVHYA